MAFRNNGNKIAVNKTISNVSINLIQITEDKLMNILNEHVRKIKKSNDWIGAVMSSLSLLGILSTSSFKDSFGLTKYTLQAFFILIFVISIIYAFHTIYNCIKNKSNVTDIISDIKGQE